MSYKLFIDDERFPFVPDQWVIARSMFDVQLVIAKHGWPSFISFDHDLGEGQPSGKDIANWIVESDLSDNVLPDDFEFTVHSMNPVGGNNISGLLRQYLTVRRQ